MSRRRCSTLPGALLRPMIGAVLGVLILSAPAWARKVEDIYAGRIVISPHGFPRMIHNTGTFVAFLKSHGVDVLPEQRDKAGKEEGTWQLRYMAFFRRPLSDVSLEVKFFEISNGDDQLIQSYDLDTLDRGQRILAATLTVAKDDGFEPNKKYRMTIEDRGQILAQTTIILTGEGPHYSGQVSFTDDEAK